MQPSPPQPAPAPQDPKVAPGSAASFDDLAQSLESSFVDLPDLVDENGQVVPESERPPSFNPFVHSRATPSG